MDTSLPNSTAQSKKAPQAAYFQSLTVENLRCFGPAQTLQLADESGKPHQWTIILGDNGVGKTTLLQCLAASEPKADFPINVPPNQEYSAFVPAIGARNSSSARIQESLPRYTSRVATIDCEIIVGNTLHASYETSHSSRLRYEIVRLSKGQSTGTPTPISAKLGELACYGYAVSRGVGTISLYDDDRPDTCDSLFFDQTELLSPIEWLLTTDYASKLENGQESSIGGKVDRVKSALMRLLPGVSDFRFVPSSSSGKVRVEANFEQAWVPINELSLGYQTSMTWMVDLASRLLDRYPDSPDPLAEPAIVLIDEIDLHLHPQWQRQIIQQLTDIFKKTQFIVTAHSPLVVQAAQDANIVLLRREGDHVVIENNHDTVRNWRIDQILTSDLFGLPTARPPQIDSALEERAKILSKPRLTAQDRRRLEALDSDIGYLPVGDSPEDDEAIRLVHEIAEAAKSHKAAA